MPCTIIDVMTESSGKSVLISGAFELVVKVPQPSTEGSNYSKTQFRDPDPLSVMSVIVISLEAEIVIGDSSNARMSANFKLFPD